MATASTALQARIDAIKAKQAANLAALNKGKVNGTASNDADGAVTPGSTSAVDSGSDTSKESVVTTVAAVPTPQPHTVKPSLVTIEGAGQYEQFKMKLAELEQQLEEQVPGYVNTLRDIHREMAQDVNIVTILAEEEISIIVKGLARNMDTTVVAAKKTSTKRTQPIQLDEL